MVRYKNRYFAVEFKVKGRPAHAPYVLKKHEIIGSLYKKVQQLHGDFGVAVIRYGLTAKYCNPYTKMSLIRVQHGPHRLIASVLPLLTRVGDADVQVNVLYTGATMMKCFKFIKNFQLRKLEYYWNQMRTDEDRLKMKDALMDLPGAAKEKEST